MNKKIGLILVSLSCCFQSLIACTNISIAKNQYVTIGRTLDFPQNTGGIFAAGFAKKSNTSDLNLSQDIQNKALVWEAKYNYFGQCWQTGLRIIDGINEAGVYAGYLYLPSFTKYPQYNPSDPRPILGVMDVGNYILGVAESVQDAIAKLKEVQIIENAAPVSKQRDFLLAPLHMIIRDKSGNSAVIEWVNGLTIVYPGAGNVLTNSPTYDWQRKHAQQFDYVQTANTKAKFDGAYMNGSGFLGIPGDWTSPSRFAKATQVLKYIPEPKNAQMALHLTLSVIDAVQVPIGTDPSPTLWKSLIELSSSTYYYRSMFDVDEKKNYISVSDPTTPWVKHDIRQVFQNESLPEGFIEAICTPTPKGEVKVLINWMKETAQPVQK